MRDRYERQGDKIIRVGRGETGYYFQGKNVVGPHGVTQIWLHEQSGVFYGQGSDLDCRIQPNGEIVGDVDRMPWGINQ